MSLRHKFDENITERKQRSAFVCFANFLVDYNSEQMRTGLRSNHGQVANTVV